MPQGIYRTVPAAQGGGQLGAQQTSQQRIADFSYQNESLAQMIVYAWSDQNFRNQLLNHNTSFAKQELAARGVYLKAPYVITEAEYYGGFTLPVSDGVAFVLPDEPRTDTAPQGQTLLETAKLLMACTPNGI
jgi:hypothetical protein